MTLTFKDTICTIMFAYKIAIEFFFTFSTTVLYYMQLFWFADLSRSRLIFVGWATVSINSLLGAERCAEAKKRSSFRVNCSRTCTGAVVQHRARVDY